MFKVKEMFRNQKIIAIEYLSDKLDVSAHHYSATTAFVYFICDFVAIISDFEYCSSVRERKKGSFRCQVETK